MVVSFFHLLHLLCPFSIIPTSSLAIPLSIISVPLLLPSQDWVPSDPSAYCMLLPWKDVFTQEQMDSLINRAIMPKLTSGLKAFRINPRQQDTDPFAWVMLW